MDAIGTFLGGGMDVSAMASAIDPTLYRNRLPEDKPATGGE